MSPRARLHTAAILISALTLAAIATYLWQVRTAELELRKSTLHEAERRATQLASATGTHIEQLVRGVNLALQQLRRNYGSDDQSFEKTVQSVLGTLGGALERVTVFDANGLLTYASTGQSGPINISDRAHFRFHADSSEDRLYITQPLLSRVTNHWVILMSRPIRHDGKFAGVVIIALFPQQLSAQLARITLAPEDVVALLRADGKFLARSREWEEVMGKAVATDRPFLRPGSADEGTFRAAGSMDATPRTFAWHRLRDNGLIVVVGLAEEALLAPLRRDEQKKHRLNAAVVVVMLLLGGGTALLLMRMARQQEQLASNEVRYRRLHESMVDAYARVDMNGKLVEWNRSYEQMLGYSPEQLRSKTYQDLTPRRWHEMEARIVTEEVIAKGHSEVYEKEYVRSDGSVFPVEIRVFLLRNDREEPVGMWGIVRDITERKLIEAQIHHLAHHDALTGLPNRVALNLRLDQAIAAAHRDEDRIAVMLIDLDRFKSINDNLGHLIGDRLLIEVARRQRYATATSWPVSVAMSLSSSLPRSPATRRSRP